MRNVSGWLTTIVTRVCLNTLRARAARPEQPAGMHMPDPIAIQADDAAPLRSRRRCSPNPSGWH